MSSPVVNDPLKSQIKRTDISLTFTQARRNRTVQPGELGFVGRKPCPTRTEDIPRGELCEPGLRNGNVEVVGALAFRFGLQ